jgi:hypothetical protein
MTTSSYMHFSSLSESAYNPNLYAPFTLILLNGGSAWESNPPARVLAPHTGFEVREPHQ